MPLAKVNLSTKYDEVSISVHYGFTKGDAKCTKWSGLGYFGVNHGQ